MLRPSRPMIRRELDQRHSRLRGVVRGNALERVGDEVSRPALGLGTRLLLCLAHSSRELVADQFL